MSSNCPRMVFFSRNSYIFFSAARQIPGILALGSCHTQVRGCYRIRKDNAAIRYVCAGMLSGRETKENNKKDKYTQFTDEYAH